MGVVLYEVLVVMYLGVVIDVVGFGYVDDWVYE